MHIETERLVIRELEMTDAADLLKIKYDPQVMEYAPDFIKCDASEADIEDAIRDFIGRRDAGDFAREYLLAVTLREDGALIGVICISESGILRETEMGWMFRSEYCGRGYASEAARAASDAVLRTYGMPYLIVTMDVDNPASFRTAQKSGFRLFEKRVPYDYHYSRVDVEKPDEVDAYFAKNQAEVGPNYYYFRKYHPDDQGAAKFYGDTVYDGRFS